MLPQHANYSSKDDKPLLDGDTVFYRMNMATEPDLLQPGEYAFGRNVRTRRGKPSTRRGIQFMEWSRAAERNTTPVYGSCAFRGPNGDSYILKARANHCEACDPTGGVQVIQYPAGVTLDDTVSLEQLFDRVLMSRGRLKPRLEWAPPGDWVNPFNSGFALVASDPVAGTQPVPHGDWVYSFKNRAMIRFCSNSGSMPATSRPCAVASRAGAIRWWCSRITRRF